MYIMKKTIYDYIDSIKKLPIKDKYLKEDILIEDFLVNECDNIKVYYAPHNEYINYKAKIFIIGITPGFQQMSTSIKEARILLEENENIEVIQYKCKVKGRFSGSLRKNIINMLDYIKLNHALNLKSCSELFYEKDYLLHTFSLIPYSVFVKGKNYTGHTPKLINNKFLMSYVYENFLCELNELENVIIIPLGKAVEEVLNKLSEENTINGDNILRGFPHPSGANVNRLIQLEEKKENMMKFIKNKFQ